MATTPAGGDVGLISLADAKKELNLTSADNDDEVQFYVNAACRMIEKRVGTTVPLTVTETATATGNGTLLLSRTPVLSIVSVTSGGVAVDSSGWVVDSGGQVASGGLWTVRRRLVPRFTLSGQFDVTYLAGRAPVPEHLQLAARQLVKHLWSTQRGKARTGGSSDDQPFGAGFAWPNRVQQLIADDQLLPGIA